MQADQVRRNDIRPLIGIVLAVLVLLPAPGAQAITPAQLVATYERAVHAEATGDGTSAMAGYRQVLLAVPDHTQAYRRLTALAGNRRLPKRSTAYDTARELLPNRFKEIETSRFIVLSDADQRWTQTQSQRLERAHHQFQRFTRRLNLYPLPLRHKLVCVLFRNRIDYQAFARCHDGVTEPWIAGYYAPQHDRIVFYDVVANPAIVEARSTLADMQDDLQQIHRQASEADRDGHRDQAKALRVEYARYRQHLARERQRVNDFESRLSAATTIHEAVHQLMFHTNVQSPQLMYPLWISEGLATAFETDDSGVAFGPDHEHGPRREEFSRLLRADGLIPLQKLIEVNELSSAKECTVHSFYHQSYALFTWMQRFRQRELRAYFMTMLECGIHGARPDNVAIFEQVFGDVASLEQAWLAYERNRDR
jgi:hypothetical protein